MHKNKDPLAPWNRPPYKDDPAAPHNRGGPEEPGKPWNKPLWHPEDLSMEERKFYGIDFEYYSFKKFVYGKPK